MMDTKEEVKLYTIFTHEYHKFYDETLQSEIIMIRQVNFNDLCRVTSSPHILCISDDEDFHTRAKCEIRSLQLLIMLMMVFWVVCTEIRIRKANFNVAP